MQNPGKCQTPQAFFPQAHVPDTYIACCAHPTKGKLRFLSPSLQPPLKVHTTRVAKCASLHGLLRTRRRTLADHKCKAYVYTCIDTWSFDRIRKGSQPTILKVLLVIHRVIIHTHPRPDPGSSQQGTSLGSQRAQSARW